MSDGEDFGYVRDCLNGNSRAFEPLVARYEKVIYNVALRMVSDAQEAEDITQTTFVKAYENLRSFNPKYKFFSWIYRIAVNESLNALSQRKNHERLSEEIAAEDQSPEESLRMREVQVNVQKCLMRLKLEYRVVIVLNYFEDLTYNEISYVLDIPEKTVKSRLFTARQLLKEMLVKRQMTND